MQNVTRGILLRKFSEHKVAQLQFVGNKSCHLSLARTVAAFRCTNLDPQEKVHVGNAVLLGEVLAGSLGGQINGHAEELLHGERVEHGESVKRVQIRVRTSGHVQR